MGYLYLSLIIIALAFPILMTLRAWIVFRAMRGFVAVASIVGHLIIPMVLFRTDHSRLACGYLVAVILAWTILPFTGSSADRMARRRIRMKDIARLQQKIQRSPEHAAAHSALADAYMEDERFDEAIAAYERAIALDPDHCRADRWKCQQAIELRASRERQRTRR